MRWDDSLYADLVKQFDLYGIAYIRHLVACGIAHYYIGSDFDLAPFMDVWDIFTFGCSLSNGGRIYVRGPSMTAAPTTLSWWPRGGTFWPPPRSRETT